MTREWQLLVKTAAGKLQQAGIERPYREASLLWCGVSGQDLSQWILYGGSLSSSLVEEYRLAIKRRVAREPFHYIIGVREFMGLNFHVDPRVLIPRPETEQLVERILTDADKRALLIADVGTGSGAIAISLVYFGHFEWRVMAIDVSEEALSVAKLNGANLLKNRGHIDFVQGDLLTDILEPVDIVAANLPYVTEEGDQEYFPELSYEPRIALYAPEGGLKTILRLIKQLPSRLKAGGRVYLEVGGGQAARVEQCLTAQGLVILPRTHDLARIDRVVAAEKPLGE